MLEFTHSFMTLFSGNFTLESLNFKRQETLKLTMELRSLMTKLNTDDIMKILYEEQVGKMCVTSGFPKK